MSRSETGASFSNYLQVNTMPITAYPISVACWVKMNGVSAGYGRPFLLKNTASDELTFYAAAATGAGSFKSCVANQATSASATDMTIPSGWFPLIIVLASGSENGVVGGRISSTTKTWNADTGAWQTNTGSALTEALAAFNGKIAHLCILSKAVTTLEGDDFVAGRNPKAIWSSADLVRYYPFTDASLVDASGNSSDTFTVFGTVDSDAADNPTVDAPPASGIAGVSHTARLSQGSAFSSALRLF